HSGSLVQFGLNAGPRDARIFGFAQSLLEKYRHEDPAVLQYDLNFLAGISFLWNRVCTIFPTQITQPIIHALEDCGMPPHRSPFIPPGSGYTMKLNGQEYYFPDSLSAPPEGYFSRGYESYV
ncbi:hypothetical protein SISNIDRAFT_385622, partial [Sistotremastrum niveocremeum HHB9708]